MFQRLFRSLKPMAYTLIDCMFLQSVQSVLLCNLVYAQWIFCLLSSLFADTSQVFSFETIFTLRSTSRNFLYFDQDSRDHLKYIQKPEIRPLIEESIQTLQVNIANSPISRQKTKRVQESRYTFELQQILRQKKLHVFLKLFIPLIKT